MPGKMTELAFEEAIEASLVTEGGYRKGDSATFDRVLGLDTGELLLFVRATQQAAWLKLVGLHGSEGEAQAKFFGRVATQIDQRGTVDVLRRGVVDLGVTIQVAFFKPAHGLTPELVERYEANRLSVVRQFRFDPASDKSIDLALLVNGIPVATAELKNHLTGQTVEHAKAQYRKDRDPKNVTLARRAVVHFAVDPDLVFMTTALAGGRTRFLPFNRGDQMGEGNPPNPAGHRTSYLWERVWARDAWMDLLARFVHVTQPTSATAMARAKSGSVIFPRFHQWDAVLQLEADARTNGAGQRYLVEHSAGSGKSNTIAWLAHRLMSLHDGTDAKVFDKVVVITDRVVLDQQLQDTIYQFEHVQGVVERIDKDSTQLAEALTGDQARIIITTLQKFPYVLKQIGDLSGRRYAVLVDEAHSSQTGESVKALKAALGSASAQAALASAEAAEADGVELDPEDRLAASVAARGHQPNLSFFAFTATPKPKTLELFGRKGASGNFEPFHLYSMRQAIEEGFILDVLANYVTYDTYWKVEKAVAEDPTVDKAKAQAAIARFVSLHPHNLAQKAEIIVEHYRRHVAPKIGGHAKAMVVTASRLHAVRYKEALDRYIAEKGYGDVHTLVAFSGTVVDDGLEHTESKMNAFPESETAARFKGEVPFDPADFQVMVVAEKFQTGFDLPLLHTMYVDKKLDGVHAVQTLSRLNRIHPGKTDTFVLDFRNDTEAIQDAFRPFYARTEATPTDPNVLWDAHDRLADVDVIRPGDVAAFAQVFFSGADPKAASGPINAHLDPAVDRFKNLDDDTQIDWRAALDRFVRLYAFLSQIITYGDADLERDYVYAKALAAKLPQTGSGSLDLGSEVELTHLRTEVTATGNFSLDGGGEPLTAITGDGTGRKVEPTMEALSTIVDLLNERFGTNLSDADKLLFDQFEEDWVADPELGAQAQSNDLANFGFGFDKKFEATIIGRMDINDEIFRRLMDDATFAEAVRSYYRQQVYERLREGQDA